MNITRHINQEATSDLSSEEFLKLWGEKYPKPEIYSTINSTNIRAKELAKQGCSHMTVVVADEQTAGRGRFGRHFYSIRGNGLYMSLILRPSLNAYLVPQLTAYAALAVAEAIEEFVGGFRIDIKWVNDLCYEGKKLAGILTEASFLEGSEKLEYAVVGIGINFKGELPPEISDIATTIEKISVPPKRSELAFKILEKMEKAEDEILNHRYIERYRERCFIIGKEVSVFLGENMYSATVIDVLDDARLLVVLDNNEKMILHSGEVSLKFKR